MKRKVTPLTKRLVYYRKKSRFSARELAEYIGITAKSMYAIEYGYSILSPGRVKRLVNFYKKLDIDASDLIVLTEQQRKYLIKKNYSEEHWPLICTFAQTIESLPEQKINRIKQILTAAP